MNKEGSKILTIGKGAEEKKMFQTLLDVGFDGPIGILGHIENEDVKIVLERNLEGLQTMEFLKKI
jgi:hypothetical protein